MKSAKISAKDTALIILLFVIIIGVVYYLAFYTPLRNELASIADQSSQLDTEMTVLTEKINSMDAMQAELDEIFSRPADEITEIAPYDNAKAVMNFLNGILSRSNEYQLSFSDPDIEESGTVRRSVALSFSCSDYATAKSILNDLAGWNYRCLLGSVTLTSEADEGIALAVDTADKNPDTDNDNVNKKADAVEDDISVTASMTFFESLNLS